MFENITYSDIVNAPPIEDCTTCIFGRLTARVLCNDGKFKSVYTCFKSGTDYFECLLNGRKEWREKNAL